MKLTPDLILAATLDAGNRSMRKAGRTTWNEEDRDAAFLVNATLWAIYEPAPHDVGRDGSGGIGGGGQP